MYRIVKTKGELFALIERDGIPFPDIKSGDDYIENDGYILGAKSFDVPEKYNEIRGVSFYQEEYLLEYFKNRLEVQAKAAPRKVEKAEAELDEAKNALSRAGRSNMKRYKRTKRGVETAEGKLGITIEESEHIKITQRFEFIWSDTPGIKFYRDNDLCIGHCNLLVDEIQLEIKSFAESMFNLPSVSILLHASERDEKVLLVMKLPNGQKKTYEWSTEGGVHWV